ncbi:MAG TPA: type II CAAX endopeptidase family protein [Verrucomicrobiae bacterium]|nr:type II CAAX endopeptidase family protein [Verrucomicrobiae bacterium]
MADTTTTAPQLYESSGRNPVAPIWHTTVFVLLILGLSSLQATKLPMLEAHGRTQIYLSGMAFEIALVLYVWLLGVRPQGKRLSDLVGGRWAKPMDVLRDIGVALLFWCAVIGFLLAMRLILGANAEGTRAVKMLLPRTTAEIISYLALCVTAGFCEELLFRGYLQRQFFAWSGRVEMAVALQALVFGLGHLYQGWKGALTITLYGAMFGILAVMRKSLRPGMIQHMMQDSFTGVVGSLLVRHGRL